MEGFTLTNRYKTKESEKNYRELCIPSSNDSNIVILIIHIQNTKVDMEGYVIDANQDDEKDTKSCRTLSSVIRNNLDNYFKVSLDEKIIIFDINGILVDNILCLIYVIDYTSKQVCNINIETGEYYTYAIEDNMKTMIWNNQIYYMDREYVITKSKLDGSGIELVNYMKDHLNNLKDCNYFSSRLLYDHNEGVLIETQIIILDVINYYNLDGKLVTRGTKVSIDKYVSITINSKEYIININDEKGNPIVINLMGDPIEVNEDGNFVIIDEDGSIVITDRKGKPIDEEDEEDEEEEEEEDSIDYFDIDCDATVKVFYHNLFETVVWIYISTKREYRRYVMKHHSNVQKKARN